jgi:thiol:disulfide interchange protein
MPSSKRTAIVAGLVLFGIGVFLYAVVIQQLLPHGAGVAVSSFVIAALVYYGGTGRRTLVRAAIVVTLVYGVFTFQLPLAVIAACAVYLSAWLTSVDGPFDAPDTTIFPVERATVEESEESE